MREGGRKYIKANLGGYSVLPPGALEVLQMLKTLHISHLCVTRAKDGPENVIMQHVYPKGGVPSRIRTLTLDSKALVRVQMVLISVEMRKVEYRM